LGVHLLATETKKRKKPYLYEVDLMRVIFIFGVLANHATSTVTAPMHVDSGQYIAMLATHLILHFTRMGFMFISGLVLFLQYYHKSNNVWPTFWGKRYKGSGIPYIFWNGFFTFFTTLVAAGSMSFAEWGTTWWSHLIHADGFYMYYIFVMFQLYLIFPLLVWMFKKLKTMRNHLILMGISFLFQIAFTAWAKYYFPYISHDGWPYLFSHYGNFILSYQFYFLVGGFSSIHYKEVVAFLDKVKKPLYAITAVLAAGTLGLYYFNVNVLGLTRHYAELIHQPYLVIYARFMVATVFSLSLGYAKRRTRPRWQPFAKFVSLSSKISFGIYLTQSIMLTLIAEFLTKVTLPDWAWLVSAPLVYIVALGGTWLISFFCYKVPPFGVLIGRPNFPLKKKTRAEERA
jgi:peptidoglycan/LPS O-acetylase OafA/YrhL